MFKIWSKTILEEKITRDIMYENNEKFDINKFSEYLIEVCYELDIPTPLILSNHIKNFDKFNNVSFSVADFVESIDFEKLVLEYVDTTKNDKK